MLLPPPDPVLDLARNEARRSACFVALPNFESTKPTTLLANLSSMEEYADHVDEGSSPKMTATIEWVARKDRPLLRAADTYEPAARRWPMLDFAATRLNPEGGKSEKFVVAEQTLDDRKLLLNEWRALNVTGGVVPPDLKLQFSSGAQMVIIEPDGRQHVFHPMGKAQPFDPARYATKFAAEDEDPLPPELRKAAQSVRIDRSGTAELSSWIEGAGLPGIVLGVDARAKEWLVSVAPPPRGATEADLLEGLARAHRLFWRSVGPRRWFLSASPDGETAVTYTVRLARGVAMAKLFTALRPLARAGGISDDTMFLMTVPQRQTIGSLDAVMQRRFASFLRAARRSPDPDEPDAQAFDRLRNDPERLARCTFVVNYQVAYGFLWNGNNFGSGVMLP